MKFTIDTETKVIEINEEVNLSELVDKLKEILGKDWKNYKLNQSFSWYYPYIPYYPTIYDNNTPLDGTYEITCNDTDTTWVNLIKN